MDFQRLIAIASAGGGVGLAGFRVLYDRFYGQLGITVDEVGLSNWQMVTWAIAGWVAMLPLVVQPCAR